MYQVISAVAVVSLGLEYLATSTLGTAAEKMQTFLDFLSSREATRKRVIPL